MTNLVGQRFSQYEITALLGEGGMAAVYKARRVHLKSDVAIKVIKSGLVSPERMNEFVKRFEFEAQTIAMLSHPHILKLFDYGQHESTVYLVMELLTGGSLAELIAKSPLSIKTTQGILDQIGSALDYAHERGIIHRDLKPQNILLDERGNAILTDFGIAKLMGETTEMTGSSVAMGTPAYMAPEQWRGEPIDTRIDIYALGAVLFQMLSGKLPFAGDTPHSMMHMHIYEAPPSLCSIMPEIPEAVDQVIGRALAKEPNHRFEKVAQLVTAFNEAIDHLQPVSARNGSGLTAVGTLHSAVTPIHQEPFETAARRVFLSYARPDQRFAERLRSQLHAWNYGTWMDVHDIPKGSYWPNAIDEGLQSSDVVIGLMSPESLDSRNVRNEWDWALENGKVLLLLLMRPCEHIPHRYISITYIDFSQDERQAFGQLETALTAPTTPYQETEITSPAKTQEVKPKQNNRNRMLEKVYDFWIVGVLENALHERKAFNLEMEFAAPGALLKSVERSDYKLPSSASIYDVFADMNRELLILGQPGAGKTILLLQLARELILRARRDETQAIPVVFNLSSWAFKRDPIETWLVDELRVKYQVPRKLASTWINNGEALPLLDGLDEVKVDYQDECIEAINTFRQEYNFVDMVVCSRVEDYGKLTNRLNLQSSIVLQPLTQIQIDNHIQGEELVGLRTVMQSDPVLQQMAQTPFLLNTMTFAYRGMSAAAQSGITSEEERHTHLFQNYVERKFQQQATAKTFTLKQTLHWLSVLAHQMVGQGQTVFFIERMQPYWLSSPQRRQYELLVALIGGLIGGLGNALAFILVGSAFGASSAAALSGLIVGVVFGVAVFLYFAFSAHTQDIEVTEALSWSWSRGRIGLAIGLVGGIGGGLVYAFIYHTLVGFPFGLVMGLAIGMAFGLTGALGGSQLEMRTVPNQGVRRSARNAILIVVFFGLFFNVIVGVVFGVMFALAVGSHVDFITKLAFGLTSGLVLGLVGGLTFGLALGLIRGGKPVIEHLVLRMLLNRNDDIPANYSRFLDYATHLNILRKVGGGYIFVHRYLLEYFATLRA